jgi:hypothetical protein
VKSTLENPIELQVVQLAWDYLGILGSKLKVLGDTSWPDRIFWLPGGKPLLIEFKRQGFDPQPQRPRLRHPSPRQRSRRFSSHHHSRGTQLRFSAKP